MSILLHDTFRTATLNPAYYSLPYEGTLIALNNKFFFLYERGARVLEFSAEYFTFWWEYFLPTNPDDKPCIPTQLQEIHFIFSQIPLSLLQEIQQWISYHIEFYWREVAKRHQKVMEELYE